MDKQIPTIETSKVAACHTRKSTGTKTIICDNEDCNVKYQCQFFLKESELEK